MNNKVSIAYLIFAYNNPIHLKKLIKALNDGEASIFIHIDKKSKMKLKIPVSNKIHIINDPIKIYWGSMNFTKAIIKLILEAINKDKYDFFILLSGTDYPIRSNAYIRKFLAHNKDKEFIDIERMPLSNKPFERIEYYYISTFDQSIKLSYLIKRFINLFIRRMNIKRCLPDEYLGYILYGGSTWWCLTGECINYIIDFIKNNPKFIKYYENTFIPDEMFFHTIIGNSKFMRNVKPSFTYADWSKQNAKHPALISPNHLSVLAHQYLIINNMKTNILFARKFTDNAAYLVDKIDRCLRFNKFHRKKFRF